MHACIVAWLLASPALLQHSSYYRHLIMTQEGCTDHFAGLFGGCDSAVLLLGWLRTVHMLAAW